MKECRNLTVRHFKSSNVLDGRSGWDRSTLCENRRCCMSVCQTTFNWLHGVVSRICRPPNSSSLELDYSLHTRRQQQQQQNCAIRSSTSRNIAHITHCMQYNSVSLIVSDLPTNCRALTDWKKLFYLLLFKYSVNDVFLIICPTVLSRCHIATDWLM